MGTETTNEPATLDVNELVDGSAQVVIDGGADGSADGSADERLDGSPSGGSQADDAASTQADNAGLDNAALSDPEREAIRERRRQERQQRKSAQREREDNLRNELALRDREIAEMRGRMAMVEQRNTQADLAQLDNAAKRAGDAVRYYRGVIEEATKKQDGAVVADATERMMIARSEHERLTNIKNTFVNNTNNQQAVLDPTIKAKAEAWAKDNPWYKADASTQDSELVLTIDRRLASEGFDPRTDAYWNELSGRVAKYLPHVAKKPGYTGGTSQERSVGTPVAGSGREGGAGNGSRSGSTYQLSAQRVQALKDAGVWDDPKARSDAIRRYHDYDRKTASNA